jgi:hypothetical protein
MDSLLLTTKEYADAYIDGTKGKYTTYSRERIITGQNTQLIAQCKKMYEWLNGICKTHKVKGKDIMVCRVDCVQCNKELRRFLGIEG